ncbi:uncharacterized protein [Rutidosis leptorrhynchoides]|uniref:uncharacterized protein isoform X2 n=1 Tax=Rutidosis leptorrhynchoides TaxID=125765 RepID=UPI003A998CAC
MPPKKRRNVLVVNNSNANANVPVVYSRKMSAKDFSLYRNRIANVIFYEPSFVDGTNEASTSGVHYIELFSDKSLNRTNDLLENESSPQPFSVNTQICHTPLCTDCGVFNSQGVSSFYQDLGNFVNNRCSSYDANFWYEERVSSHIRKIYYA